MSTCRRTFFFRRSKITRNVGTYLCSETYNKYF